MMKDLQIDTSKLIVAGIVILFGVLMVNSKTDYTDTMWDWSTKTVLLCSRPWEWCVEYKQPKAIVVQRQSNLIEKE